jgi:hypothetical protein
MTKSEDFSGGSDPDPIIETDETGNFFWQASKFLVSFAEFRAAIWRFVSEREMQINLAGRTLGVDHMSRRGRENARSISMVSRMELLSEENTTSCSRGYVILAFCC